MTAVEVLAALAAAVALVEVLSLAALHARLVESRRQGDRECARARGVGL